MKFTTQMYYRMVKKMNDLAAEIESLKERVKALEPKEEEEEPEEEA